MSSSSLPAPTMTPAVPGLPDVDGAVAEAVSETPPSAPLARRGVAGWIIYDFGNTLYSQNMLVNYFPVWVVAVMGGSDLQISLVNTITMALMLGVGPWLGAVSDRMARRLPILIGTTSVSCLLTFFVGGELAISLALMLVANLCFQSSLIMYDSLLPAVSTPENRGRIGGAAVGLGLLGSILGLGIGFLVLSRGGSYAMLFRLTAIAYILLALPCFLWVKEQHRVVAALDPWTMARTAFADVRATVRRARAYPDLVRFLIGRAFYAEAANTIGIFMAVYLTVQLGFSSGQKDRLLLIGILGAVAGGLFWGRVVDRIGPRDTLLRVLAFWSLALLLIAATGFGLLPQDWLWGIAPLAGFGLTGIWSSDRPMMIGLAPPEYLGQFYGLYALAGRFASLIGPLIWGLVVNVLGLGRPVAILVLLGFVLIAMIILRPLSPSIGRPAPVVADAAGLSST
jgi:UMF1 family MFS transporter